MKNMILKLCKGLLGLLGIVMATSCDDILGGMVCEYGTPSMDYTVMGKVVNARNEALKGIKVKTMSRNGLSGRQDSTYTDVSGNFTVSQENVFPNKTVPIVFEDESGTYKSDTLDVKLTQVKEGKNWYSGKFAAEDVKVTLEDK